MIDMTAQMNELMILVFSKRANFENILVHILFYRNLIKITTL